MKKVILFMLIALVYHCQAQSINVEKLISALDQSLSQRVSFCFNEGFEYSNESTNSIMKFEKIQNKIPNYQQLQLSKEDNTIVYMSSDGGYYASFLANYPDKYMYRKEDGVIMLYDKDENISIGLSVSTNTHIPYYFITIAKLR